MATLVFGLDGGNWELIEPWIKSGDLPTIKHLRDNGVWGISESVLPPVTCPNWKCYASSQPPGHHDVYWWEKVNRNDVTVDVPDADSFTAPELWDYLDDEALVAGVMNLPMTYPPRDVGEFIIAGGPRSREEEFTFPPELEDELESQFDYRVHPKNVVTSNEDAGGVDATLELIETRFETARTLLEKRDLDFLHLTIFHLNVLQHYFYDGEPTRRAWELIDREIKKFLNDGHTIFLMSDHGCTEIETVFHINEWLKEEGLLTMEPTTADLLMKLGITQERLAGVVRSLGLESAIRKHVPRRLVERFPDDEGIKRDNKFEKVVTDESDAIASGQGLVYVLHESGSPVYEEKVSRLVDRLSTLETPAGTRVATEVYRGEEIYPHGNPRYRPDIVFNQTPGLHTSGAVGKEQIFESPGRWRAENVREGMFVAYGEGIDPLGKIDPISILDIAPTILHAMGLDVPESFEGEPIREVDPHGRSVTYRPSLPDRGEGTATESDDVEERLADLGYLE